MSETTVEIGGIPITKNRTFKALEALEDEQSLRITYLEQTIVGGEIIKSENKCYTRNYDFWKKSELGISILAMVNLDLKEEDPSVPRQ